MNNYPTIQNPLEIVYPGTVPALKNRKQLVKSKNGKASLINSKTVDKFNSLADGYVSKAIQRAGFDIIPDGTHIGVFARVVFATSKDKNTEPNNDLDNAFTTLQETLEHHVIQNDRQVYHFYAQKELVHNANFEMGRLWVWVSDEKVPMILQQFLVWKNFIAKPDELEILNEHMD